MKSKVFKKIDNMKKSYDEGLDELNRQIEEERVRLKSASEILEITDDVDEYNKSKQIIESSKTNITLLNRKRERMSVSKEESMSIRRELLDEYEVELDKTREELKDEVKSFLSSVSIKINELDEYKTKLREIDTLVHINHGTLAPVVSDLKDGIGRMSSYNAFLDFYAKHLNNCLMLKVNGYE